MLPRKVASVLVRAPLMRRSLGRCGPSLVLLNAGPAYLFMICSNIKLICPKESIGQEDMFFYEQSQWDLGTLHPPPALKLAHLTESENAPRSVPQPQNPERRGCPL